MEVQNIVQLKSKLSYKIILSKILFFFILFHYFLIYKYPLKKNSIKLRPQCISFDPHGDVIAIGFTSGDIKFLSTSSFEDVAAFSPSADPIVHLKFSPSGLYLAAYDSTNHVIILKRFIILFISLQFTLTQFNLIQFNYFIILHYILN